MIKANCMWSTLFIYCQSCGYKNSLSWFRNIYQNCPIWMDVPHSVMYGLGRYLKKKSSLKKLIEIWPPSIVPMSQQSGLHSHCIYHQLQSKIKYDLPGKKLKNCYVVVSFYYYQMGYYLGLPIFVCNIEKHQRMMWIYCK